MPSVHVVGERDGVDQRHGWDGMRDGEGVLGGAMRSRHAYLDRPDIWSDLAEPASGRQDYVACG